MQIYAGKVKSMGKLVALKNCQFLGSFGVCWGFLKILGVEGFLMTILGFPMECFWDFQWRFFGIFISFWNFLKFLGFSGIPPKFGMYQMMKIGKSGNHKFQSPTIKPAKTSTKLIKFLPKLAKIAKNQKCNKSKNLNCNKK